MNAGGLSEVIAERLARIEEGVKECRKGIDRINGSVRDQVDDLAHLKEHANDEHAKLWAAISGLRVRDAYVAGTISAIWLLVQWLLDRL